jgi:hypothetical protein
MLLLMITCTVCKNELLGRSLYTDLLAEMRSDTDRPGDPTKDTGTRQIAHIECCSVNQIKKILISQAKEQISLYKDLFDLIESMQDSHNNDIRLRERISEFETKYGSFDELRQGSTIDHNLLTSALISELIKKLQ